METQGLGRRKFIAGAAMGAWFAAASAAAAATVSSPPVVGAKGGRLRIAHLTDPQLGFGVARKTFEENYAADLERLERAIALVNSLKPDIALVTGDMTHRAGDVAKDWPRLLELFKMPVAVAPGNHDLGNRVEKENLARYRSVFGADRKAFDLKGWRIVAVNTQFLFGTNLKDEKARYGEWIAAELKNAEKYRGRVILAGHYPPFTDSINEKDAYENFPRKIRTAKLESDLAAGAKFYLAGHTHRFAARGFGELTILNAETTSNSFDRRPFGFRMFEVDDNMDYSYRFVRVRA